MFFDESFTLFFLVLYLLLIVFSRSLYRLKPWKTTVTEPRIFELSSLHLLTTSVFAIVSSSSPSRALWHLHFGLKISYSFKGYYLIQAKYIFDLISRANLTDSKIVNTLTELNTRLTPHDGEPFHDFTLYRHLVGSLIYLAVTQPNISYAVHQVSQFMAAPRSTHFSAVLRILWYLKGTLFLGLCSSSPSLLQLDAYTDVDWAGDLTDRRSTTGYYFLLGTSLISWWSKKQTVVAQSSTMAEYCALADTTSELL